MSEKGLTVEFKLPGRRKTAPAATPAAASDPVPRLARLLALAWKWELAVRHGETTCTEIARRHGLSRARVTQVCGLAQLAPDLQEVALHHRHQETPSNDLRRVTIHPSWEQQKAACGAPSWTGADSTGDVSAPHQPNRRQE